MDQVAILGVPLDPDEREESVVIKTDPYARRNLTYHNPYDALISRFSFANEPLGNAPIDSWLTPYPEDEEMDLCTVENYVTFIDTDGCWDTTMFVKDSMDQMLNDQRSLMIAVDHSVASASILRSCEQYGKEECGIIIFDSHFDGILPSYRCGLIHHDIEKNPNTMFDANDPFIFGRSQSFNADSFLFKLIDEKYILPENVVVIGVSDYPSKKASSINDERVGAYVDFYHHYEDMGVTIVPKQKLSANPRAFDPSKMNVSKFHVSMDIDVGSRNAIYGARFIDYKGLSEQEIYSLIKKIKDSKQDVVSADISEIDVWKAGIKHYGKLDKTYDIAAKIGNMLFSK